MKRKLSLFLILSLLICLMIPSHADTVDGVDDVDELCQHHTLMRISDTKSRCVSDGDAIHSNETYFTACCADCGEYRVEVIESQQMSPHNYVLTDDECQSSKNHHVYVFTCKDCEHEVIMLQTCVGYHPNEE